VTTVKDVVTDPTSEPHGPSRQMPVADDVCPLLVGHDRCVLASSLPLQQSPGPRVDTVRTSDSGPGNACDTDRTGREVDDSRYDRRRAGDRSSRGNVQRILPVSASNAQSLRSYEPTKTIPSKAAADE
jgi:hypothetical protein